MKTSNNPQRRRIVFGDKERVKVDGEWETVIDSPSRDSYTVELDSGGRVLRMESTIEPAPLAATEAADAIYTLRSLGDWFDSPDRSPRVMTRHGVPGMLLREIASELERTIASKNPSKP